MSENEASRRKFLKKAALGGAAVVATAGAAGKAASLALEASMNGSDRHYISQGDKALAAREYVEMSPREKAAQVKMFIDNYKKEAV